MSKNESRHPKGYWMSVGISIGIAIGAALGPTIRDAMHGITNGRTITVDGGAGTVELKGTQGDCQFQTDSHLTKKF